MTRYIVDSSVAVKWFVPEVHSEHALRLVSPLHRVETVDLLAAEFANVLWRHCMSGKLSVGEARAILADLRRVPMRWNEGPGLADRALVLASRTGHPVYDCLYVALALRRRCQLVTADRRLFNALAPAHPQALLWVEEIGQ